MAAAVAAAAAAAAAAAQPPVSAQVVRVHIIPFSVLFFRSIDVS